jgi:uncharacterized protein (TIGR02284 family)
MKPHKAISLAVLSLLFATAAFAQNLQKGVGELQHLTELIKDGQEGYRMAADDAKNPALKALFQKNSAQRAEFLAKVREELVKLGGDPDEGTSVKGAIHRGWIHTRTAVTGNDDKALVNEVLRGEKAALDGYQETLSKDLPESTRQLVEAQRDTIQETYDQVKNIDLKQDIAEAKAL